MDFLWTCFKKVLTELMYVCLSISNGIAAAVAEEGATAAPASTSAVAAAGGATAVPGEEEPVPQGYVLTTLLNKHVEIQYA